MFRGAVFFGHGEFRKNFYSIISNFNEVMSLSATAKFT